MHIENIYVYFMPEYKIYLHEADELVEMQGLLSTN